MTELKSKESDLHYDFWFRSVVQWICGSRISEMVDSYGAILPFFYNQVCEKLYLKESSMTSIHKQSIKC